MTVREFTKMDASGVIYKMVDASKPAFMTNPQEIVSADKNVVRDRCGDSEIIYFEVTGKNKMTLYVR